MKKRERWTALVLALVFLALASTIYLVDNSGITGMAVSSNGVGIDPLTGNISDQLDQNLLDNQSNQDVPLSEDNSASSLQLNTQGTTSPDLTTQAVCSSWPCNCGDSISGQVTMTSDLLNCSNPFSAVFGFTASNVLLDCAGHTISTDNSNTYGFFFIGTLTNITIRNCVVYNFSTYSTYYSASGLDHIFLNNTFLNDSGGLLIKSNNTQFLNNNLDFTGSINNYGFDSSFYQNSFINSTSVGIYSTENNNTSIYNNTFINSSTNSIKIESSQQADISNNTIDAGITFGATQAGIYLTSVNNSNIENNQISNLFSYGIYLGNAKWTTIYGNTFLDNDNPSSAVNTINIDTNSPYTQVINNTFNDHHQLSTSSELLVKANHTEIINNSFYGVVTINEGGNAILYNNSINHNYFNGSKVNLYGNSTVDINTFNNSHLSLQLGSVNVSNNTFTNGLSGQTYIVSFDANGTISNNVIQAGNFIGIYSRDTYPRVENNVVSNGTSSQYGIFIQNCYDSPIQNNQVSNFGYGIYSQVSINCSYAGNIISNTSTSGIYLTDATGGNNTLEQNYLSGNSGYDLHFLSSGDSIFNNTFLNNNGTSIYAEGLSANISNNTFYNSWGKYGSDSSWSIAVQLVGAGADFFNNSLDGGYLTVVGDNSKVRSNRLANSNYGLTIANTQNAYLENNILINNTFNIFYYRNTNNVTFNHTSVTNGTYGLYAAPFLGFEVSGNTTLANVNFTGGFLNNSIILDSSNPIILYMINSSFNQSNTTVMNNAQLKNQYYVDVNVKNYENAPIQGATIYAYNNSGDLKSTGTTDNSGQLRLSLTEYYQLSDGRSYETNHTLNATIAGLSNATNINLTETNSTSLTLLIDISSVQCGIVNNDISLISDLSANGTCFQINASNLVIDGNGATVTGNQTGFGANVSGFDNITFTDITFSNFSSGLFFNGSLSDNITGVTLSNNGQGIFLINSNNSFVYTNILQSNSGNGTVLQDSFNNTIYNNKFLSNGLNAWDNGSNNWNTSYNCSEGNNILGYSCIGGNSWDDYTGDDSDYDGVGDTNLPYNSSNNITDGGDYLPLVTIPVSSCQTINSSTSLIPSSAISTTSTCFTITASNIVFDGRNSVLTYTGSSNNQYGIHIDELSNLTNITITNFHINNFFGAIYLTCTSTPNRCKNITIQNITAMDNTYGFQLANIDNGTIINNTLSGSSLYSLIILSSNLTLKNNFYSPSINPSLNSGEAIGVIDVGSASEVTMINDLINKSDNLSNLINGGSTVYSVNSTIEDNITSSSDALTYIQWFVGINVTNSTGSAIPNATVSAYWADDTLDTTAFTDSTGYALIKMTQHYYQGSTQYLTNPNILTVTKAGYTLNSSTVNITNSTSFNFTVDTFACGDQIDSDITLSSSLSSSGTCFNISADNITIDGAGQNITGVGSGSAINLNNRQNVIIKNLIISNYSSAINLSFSNSTNLTNVTVHNNSYGLEINTSYNTRCINCNVFNNTFSDALVSNTGGTDTYFINSTINVSNVSVSGTASVYVQWYVDVNTTFLNATLPLPGANVSGLFNSTQEVDATTQTLSDGFGRLTLSEVKKNITDTYYLTPHNITAYYNSSSGTSINYTGINLSITHSTSVNLNLELSCVVPVDNVVLTTNTTLCPGTYSVGDSANDGVIKIDADNVAVTCDNTIISGDSSGKGFFSENHAGTNLTGCTADGYSYGFYIMNSNNFILDNIAGNSNLFYGIYLSGSNYGLADSFSLNSNGLVGLYDTGNNNVFRNSLLPEGTITIFGSNNIIKNVTFWAGDVEIESGDNNSIINNTFNTSSRLYMSSTSSGNNAYYNYFPASSYVTDSASDTQFNTTTSAGETQGNTWLEWCDRGTDLDGDGYADNSTSSTSIDWPYNKTISTSIGGGDTHFTSSTGQDYGPKIVSCPPTVVQLGGGGGSSTTTTETSTTTETPPSSSSTTTNEFVAAEDVATNLVPIITSSKDGENTKIHFSLENTADKPMLLFAALNVSYDDTNFILKSKTLAYEGSFWSRLMGLAYSKEAVAGRLLQATIKEETPGEFSQPIRLNPGQKLERTIEVEEGFSVPRQIQFEISAFGESGNKEKVLTKDVAVDYSHKVSALGIDHDQGNNLIDIYALIVPQLSGTEGKNYFIELTFNKKDDGTTFGDFYGPYFVDQSTSLVFAQQFKYNPAVYHGDYTINAKILEESKVVVDKKFEEALG